MVNVSVDHARIWRWVQQYAPELDQRIRREIPRPNRSRCADHTHVKIAGRSAYLYRAVDSAGERIGFILSANRDLIAAKLSQRSARSGPLGHPGAMPWRNSNSIHTIVGIAA